MWNAGADLGLNDRSEYMVVFFNEERSVENPLNFVILSEAKNLS